MQHMSFKSLRSNKNGRLGVWAVIGAGGLVILFDGLFLIIGTCLEPPSPSTLYISS